MDPSKRNPAEQSSVPSSSKRQCVEDPNKQMRPIKKRRVIIAASGNIKDFEFGRLCKCFTDFCNSDIAVVVTDDCVGYTIQPFPVGTRVFTDATDWSSWKKMGDDPLHIQIVKWAHFIVIAPLSANSLARISRGLCDNLLTCVVRAWDFRKPIYVAPSMTASMWRTSTTSRQIEELMSLGFNVILPDLDEITSAEEGHVGMAGLQDIMIRVTNTMPQI